MLKHVLQHFLGAPGRWLIQSTHTFFAALQFTFCVLQRGLLYQHKHPKHNVIKQVTTTQIIFSGIDALFPTLFILSLLISFSVTAQLILFLQNIATEKEVISLLTQFVALQLGPTVTAIVLIARSGSAIAVDLGNMSINNEIKGLRLLGVDPLIYLAYPRLIGLAISQMTLAVYFSVFTMLFGVLFAGLLGSLSNFKYFFILIDAISISELCLFLIKNAICGIAIAAYACYFGLNVKNSVTEVPQATQKAIVKSLIAIFFINAIFAVF
ncbi:MAG: phospholipid/cholesterol/gamma-HCH transport system permease protein [Methyloprofundus sp.]|nr:MAG: phospholipid/cholesterol/gamma-HCH transport system permease protein [Methyloprofundus sp.]